ncbi:hypothetical protein IJ596_02220 [bacterium]|nr:hypothetical protein [bacterium]
MEVRDIYKTPKYDLIKEFFPALLNIAANARKDSHAGSVSRSGLNIGEMGASDRIFWA